MDDIPWIYVAMIFIAFVSWIRSRIRDAAEARRQKVTKRKAIEHARNSTQPATPYQSAPPVPKERGQTFREFFDEVQKKAKAVQHLDDDDDLGFGLDPSPSEAKPPPIPGAMPADLPTVETAPPLKVRSKNKRSGRATAIALRKTLTDKQNLRTALVLKEILDKPKALQD